MKKNNNSGSKDQGNSKKNSDYKFSTDELQAWDQYIDGVDKLDQSNRVTHEIKASAVEKQASSAYNKPSVNGTNSVDKTKNIIRKKRHNISQEIKIGDLSNMNLSTARNIKKGVIPIEARIDLHGYTVEKAHKSFLEFIKQCYLGGKRSVLVVTGKSGVIRKEIQHWLGDSSVNNLIVASSYSLPKDGGEGALHFLLKRNR